MLERFNSWLAARTGYRIANAARQNLPRDIIDDPRLVAYYDPGPGHGCAIFAPAERGVGFNAFALGPKSYHPWIIAARAADKSGGEAAISSVLEAYYSIVHPARLSDWLDVPTHAFSGLGALPLHAWSILPWSTEDPCETIKSIERAQLQENRLYGLDEGMSAGAKAFGPVSDDKLQMEVGRIARLFESLKSSGLDHRRPDYNLRATFLVADHGWTWLSMGGMHRVAMAAAAGVTQIPVRVAAVVRRDEAEIWPQVVSGLYDRDTALNLFDRLLERRPPKCALPWLEWVDARGFYRGP